MQLEKQVCSLELARKLKELGVQDAYFSWARIKGEWQLVWPWAKGTDYYPAFTVAELGEMLPRYLLADGLSHELKIIRSSVWRFYYGDNIYITAGTGATEADARAEMLIHLIETGLYAPDQKSVA